MVEMLVTKKKSNICLRPSVYSFYNSYLGLLLLEVGGALDILGGVRALDPSLGHVKHFPLLRLLRRL